MPNIIGGKYKRAKLEIPNKLVRPTSALKREAVFSIVESHSIKHSIELYKNKSIIDIYAGSGSIGLEAISRGMQMSYFIENNEYVLKTLDKNCKKICKNNEYEIIFEEAINGLDRRFEVEPSIIYIDPPYMKENISLILDKIIKNNIKSSNTLIIIEVSKEKKILIPEKLNIFKEKFYGKTKFFFIN